MSRPSRVDEFDDPLVLPAAPAAVRRRPVPLLAAAVPVAGAAVLWLVTGSAALLWFAALGPLIAGASAWDGARAARRDRRRAAAEAALAADRVRAAVAERHERERADRRVRHPDVAGLLARPDDVWRRGTDAAQLVIGRGDDRSDVRVSGGEGAPGAAELRRTAAVLRDAPVTVPFGAGIAVVGPPVLATAVARAIVLQACLRFPPDALGVVGSGEEWMDALPHRTAPGRRTLGVGDAFGPSDEVVVVVAPEAPPPPRCGVVLRLTGIDRAILQLDGAETPVGVEAVGVDQARSIATDLAARERELSASLPVERALPLTDLLDAPAPGALAAAIGLSGRDPVVVDLVGDGPHAVVAGVTGAGKSELLTTWVAALCAARTPAEVTFLLADFKGGTTFDALAGLPHVVGVVTDLDGVGARRAMESLRAEIRRRERDLVERGARDVDEAGLSRLVVVVDEFAALLAAHPDLHPVFTDLAARGRALGIHLILGTQRVSGVVREALLANCPLRISLRVTEGADSRAVIGVDDAARLPAGDAGRGIAFIRRAADALPIRVRIALTAPADLEAIAATGRGTPVRRPWLPPLPDHIPLSSLPAPGHGAVVLGLSDEPEHQRQDPAVLPASWRSLLVVGGAGTGRSTVLDTVAAQTPRGSLLRLPADPESAWDLVAALDSGARPGAVLVADDLDSLLARFPGDYAATIAQRCERLVRQAGADGVRVVASMQRVGGMGGRIAELFERRLVLRVPSRTEHLLVGGDPERFAPNAPPGRGLLGDREVQIAVAPHRDAVNPAITAAAWSPTAVVTGVVVRGGGARRRFADAVARAGARQFPVEEADSARSSSEGRSPLVLVGDGDAWQRSWRTLAAVRSEGDLVIDASCAAELRLLTGIRELPPYCGASGDRAWLIRDGDDPVRIRVAGEPRTPTRRSLRAASGGRPDDADGSAVAGHGEGEGGQRLGDGRRIERAVPLQEVEADGHGRP